MNEYYPLVNIQKAIEHGPFVDGLSIMNGDFPWLYQSLPEGICLVPSKPNTRMCKRISQEWRTNSPAKYLSRLAFDNPFFLGVYIISI